MQTSDHPIISHFFVFFLGETRDLASLKADKTDPKSALHKAYGRVHTILFFVGYPRSRHSLLGSLLDAHPHMVISDESTAFSRWKNLQTTWIRESIFSFYDTISSASERASTKGRRSFSLEGTVANTSSAYGYHVPNQWQGRYDEYIEVRSRNVHITYTACQRFLRFQWWIQGRGPRSQFELIE